MSQLLKIDKEYTAWLKRLIQEKSNCEAACYANFMVAQ
jgi:hypothetical protein